MRGPLWLTSSFLLLTCLRAVTLLHFSEMGNNEGWLYGTVGNSSLIHITFSFVLSLHFHTHTLIRTPSCFVMFYSWATKYFLFAVFPWHRKLCGFALSGFFITWYSKGDRDLLILGQMPYWCHIFSLGILFIYRSNLWSLLFNAPASCWISSHTHVSLQSTRCAFVYVTVTHTLLKDSRLMFYTLNLPWDLWVSSKYCQDAVQ